ncbi:ribonuclease P protein component [Dokdonia sp. Hel_I_53]|uniref:ribonuclease P protein component n=1 Tax=Dokdonia sp. Hel_I_53 TaxID=1566287 RepID=UPI0011999572|nr:ribonuclease P protein component [Dokdonia sp. Hel_I_53]TVZ52627.1 ribonuclease P protein component [Dokdonia sp. Hel_I_53]
MKYTYPKAERLKSRKIIDALFVEGHSVKSYPLRLVYLETPLPVEGINVQAGVSVSKRSFKLAVSRNRIKRLMRESYRLHKNLIDTSGKSYALLFLYTGREEISQQDLHKAIIKLIKRFNEVTVLS